MIDFAGILQCMNATETYWDEVAKRIVNRNGEKVIAGDDEPYYRYKRNKFLHLFRQLPFDNKTVLEFGSGPGGNLYEVLKRNLLKVHGVDVSAKMVQLSKELLKDTNAVIEKVEDNKIPYAKDFFDLSFTCTVLQHNIDASAVKEIVGELCRVTREEIILFERIEKSEKGNDSCVGRPVSFYKHLFEVNGFTLMDIQFLNIQVSYLFSGAIRKIFNKKDRLEGEAVTAFSKLLQKITIPITSIADRLLPAKRDLAMLVFKRR